ncbi:hypothetical protein HanXRQr2_Chr09g0414681 [Helianthus annuus]|uniref:Uncharacterized protein n=1 Tax=Helianthus annuus TaxID=4232 RepID=A0A9K3NAC2_HELAN|nr:hypothetical protein HanXRQr2_Chr09g0414681 [Helianthus annuus]
MKVKKHNCVLQKLRFITRSQFTFRPLYKKNNSQLLLSLYSSMIDGINLVVRRWYRRRRR